MLQKHKFQMSFQLIVFALLFVFISASGRFAQSNELLSPNKTVESWCFYSEKPEFEPQIITLSKTVIDLGVDASGQINRFDPSIPLNNDINRADKVDGISQVLHMSTRSDFIKYNSLSLDKNENPLTVHMTGSALLVFSLNNAAWTFGDSGFAITDEAPTGFYSPFATPQVSANSKQVFVKYVHDIHRKGCSYPYELYIDVRSGKQTTRIIIDPTIKNDGGIGS